MFHPRSVKSPPTRPLGRYLFGFLLLSSLIYFVTTPFFSSLVTATLGIATTPANPQSSLEDGLVGHWTFDGPDVDWGSSTAEIKDKSGNGNHGDAQGGMSTRSVTPGKLGQGMQFDGGDNHIVVSSALASAPPFTLCGWLKLDQLPGAGVSYTAVSIGSSLDDESYQLNIFGSGGTVEFRSTVNRDDSGLAIANSSSDIVAGTWYHVCGVFTSTASRSLYLNAVNEETDTTALPIPSVDQTGVGYTADLDDDNEFPGTLDDIRIYNRALSADEVMRLYKLGEGTKIATTPVIDELEQGLVGHWTFDGPTLDFSSSSAVVVRDISSNQLHATSIDNTIPVPGVLGQALHFQNIGPTDEDQRTCVYTAHDASINSLGPMTAAAWVRPDRDDFGDWNSLISKRSDWNYYFDGYGDGRPRFLVYYDTTDLIALSSVSIENRAGEWIHLAVTWDGTTATSGITFYHDGIPVALDSQQSAGSGVRSSATLPLVVGNIPNRCAPEGAVSTIDAFPGDMDDVRIYNRALSADEVMRLYKLGEGVKIATTVKSPGSPLENGLVGHWTFDGPDTRWQDSSSEIKDVSGNANHGDAQGGMGVNSPVMGVIGQGMGFDGVDDVINLGADSETKQTTFPFTVSGWAYVDSSTGSSTFIATSPAAYSGYHLLMKDTGQITSQVGNGGAACTSANRRTFDTTDTYALDTWHHVVSVYNDYNSQDIYVDGVGPVDATESGTGVSLGYYSDSMQQAIGGRIGWGTGCQVTGLYGSGRVDDVRIYNRALSAQEVQMLYQLGR